MHKSTSKLSLLALLTIILVATILRLVKIEQIPPALNWDEVAAGYNAYTIANWGKDEWGNILPLVFTSFKDDKHPVHIYITSIFVKIFGLSDFTTRLPGVVIGVSSVVVIFYLAQILFKNNFTALFSALFLALSPYHIQFSRGLWEINFALFFFLLGILMFYLAINKKKKLIIISYLSFGVSLLAYHSSKIIVPSIVLLLTLLYFKDLKKLSINFYIGICIFLISIGLLFIDPRLTGLARIQQTEFGLVDIQQTQSYKKTKNSLVGLGEIVFRQYLSHFTPQYLFISGDQSPRNSVKTFGEFYKIDAIFILFGLFYLLKMRSKITIILFSWLLLAPLPASLVKGAPSATRAIFMLGVFNLISSVGAGQLLNAFKGKVKLIILIILLTILIAQLFSFVDYYFNIYPKKDGHEWQYGMKQIVEYVVSHPEYDQIFTTDIRSQPYIFFLFYLKTPLPDFQNTVIYNRSETRSFSTVSSFDKYYFGGWDPIESLPKPRVLYILSPSQYDGLKYRSDFSIKKVIHYPDGGDDFFLVSVK